MDSVVLGLRVLLALACVIGLIWVLARRAGWGARRRPAGPAVEVVGRQALGRHAGVAVVAVGNRRLLLGYGEQNVTMLTELAPAPAETAASPAASGATQPAADRAPVTLGSLAAAVLPTPRRARAAQAAAAPAAPAVPAEPAAAAPSAAAAPRVPSAPPAAGSAEQRERVFAQALATASSAPVPTAGPAAAGPARDAAAASAASAAAALAAAAAIPVEPVGSEPVPGLAGLEVAEVDAARLELAAHPAEATGALHGSVLAPSTWKQAVAALRERTVRR